MKKHGFLISGAALMVAARALAADAGVAPGDVESRVRRASLATYIHGMTEEIALSEVGVEGLPMVRKLLADPGFPRRDNLVAFLDALGGADDRDALLGFLRLPPASVPRAEEERALLLAPQALGRMAGRGDRGALGALLAMTAHRSRGGILERAAGSYSSIPGLRDDLLSMSLRGLAFSGDAEAGRRLEDIASGRVVPAEGVKTLKADAAQAKALFDELNSEALGHSSGGPDATGASSDAQSSVASATAAGTLDSQTRVHDAALTFANHASLTDSMTDVRLDSVLHTASLRAGKGDFAEDVACCCTATRSGSTRTFGATGDGLDVIDTDAEMRAVLNNSAARFKVVRAINYCGGPGSNIIGCAWQPGNGAAVVRMSNLDSEAILWLHEYGHNTGLPHNSASTRYIMYGVDYGTNDGISQSECNTYHSPSSSSGMAVRDTGACTDADGDLVHAGVDNCPGASNFDQADADGDGIGDACESSVSPVCGNGIKETGEGCDGADLGGQSCVSLGFVGGTLSCTPSCSLNTSACTANLCGNGVRDSGEECDSADLGGQTCQGLGYDEGSLSCTASCSYDRSGCRCTDNDRDGIARCDGDCNDNNPTIYPGAPEICRDGIDQDCNGRDKLKGCGQRGR